jgi:hypothetical protein
MTGPRPLAYISGGITKVPDFEQRGARAEERVRILLPGWRIINPVKLDEHEEVDLGPDGLPIWTEALKRDLRYILDASLIVNLDGYTLSKGAVLENFVARELGIERISLRKLEERRGSRDPAARSSSRQRSAVAA